MDRHESEIAIGAAAWVRRLGVAPLSACFVAVLSLVYATPSISGQPYEDDAAAAMAVPASVSTVVEGGLWGERGSYRVVVLQEGFEHIYSKTYAQWLSTNDKGEPRIEKSVRVDQLSNLVPYVVGDVHFLVPSEKGSGVFEVEVANRNSQKTATAVLRVGKPGEVSVEMPSEALAD